MKNAGCVRFNAVLRLLSFCIYAQVTGDITEFTCADFLQPGSKTPVAARLSTVTHEKGCAPAAHFVAGLCCIGEWSAGAVACS